VLALHGVGESAWMANDALCNALQIINHIQDCADDYRELDRVYIPQDMLSAKGSSTSELAGEKATTGLRATLNAMLDRVDPMLKEARSLSPQVPDTRLRAETSVICSLAERLVALLRKRDPLCEVVKLSKSAVFGATVHGVARAWL
jgi:phytoene/squalene synthetase